MRCSQRGKYGERQRVRHRELDRRCAASPVWPRNSARASWNCESIASACSLNTWPAGVSRVGYTERSMSSGAEPRLERLDAPRERRLQ